MLSLLANIFRRPVQPEPIRPGDPVPPGLKVQDPHSEAVGTVSAFVDGPNGTRARVVYTGPRRTWIENVSIYKLQL